MSIPAAVGTSTSFDAFSKERFAYRHLFIVENKTSVGQDGRAAMPSLFIMRGNFPYNYINAFPVERNNSNIYFPELMDVDNLELEFYETADNQVFNYFTAWQDSMKVEQNDGSTVFSMPSVYKKNINMFRLDATIGASETDFRKVFGIEYQNCFPLRISSYPADASDPGSVNLTITFSVDNSKRITQGVQTPMASVGGPATDNPISSAKQQELTTIIEKNKLDANEARWDAQKFWSAVDMKASMYAQQSLAAYEIRKQTVDRALWFKAVAKAALYSGANITARELTYFAYTLANKQGYGRAFEIAAGASRTAADLARLLL